MISAPIVAEGPTWLVKNVGSDTKPGFVGFRKKNGLIHRASNEYPLAKLARDAIIGCLVNHKKLARRFMRDKIRRRISY